MRTRRKRKRFTWFPIIGTQNGVPENTDDTNGRIFGVPVDGSGASNAIAFPLLPDVQTDADNVLGNNAQLLLALSTDYEIERIVGKCFVGARGPNDAGAEVAPKVIQAACGLFVAKQADAQAGGGVNLPLGAPTLIELLENYSPATNDTARSPWMWKRDWILSTGRLPLSPSTANAFMPVMTNVGGANNLVGATFPTSNVQYGSVMDGPHVDSKVNRRVRSDSRLWFIVAARSLDRLLGNQDEPTANVLSEVVGCINIRVLGALRRPQKTGSFT